MGQILILQKVLHTQNFELTFTHKTHFSIYNQW